MNTSSLSFVCIICLLGAKIMAQPTWAERLGYPKDKVVLILHADDIGMCKEANISAQQYLKGGHIQSAAVMMPCEYAEEMMEWTKENPQHDIGVHLTLTSEWKTWRWAGISPSDSIPGLLDSEGKLWRKVIQVAMNASADEVETEIRAQVEKALSLGYSPSHMDTHMGTLYANAKYTQAYLKVAEEYQIPAMVLDMNNPAIVEGFKAQGYPIDKEMIGYVNAYTLPKLDYFSSAPNGDSYEDKCLKFRELISSLQPGLTEIIFHPSVETENLKKITNSWQQRVWEAQMFADPEMKKFLQEKGIIFTNWIEIMERHKERG
ncbi:MAG: polysaccharide deacetylase family protein [Bacteroidota bacterium]